MAHFDNGADSTVHHKDDQSMMEHLVSLPKRILRYHELDDLTHMVLHSLSHNQCFGLKKATYLVDNPDFDHLKGVASFTKDECCLHKEDIWEKPECFVPDMEKAPYHHDIKKFLKMSLKKKNIDLHSDQDIKDLGKDLGMENPSYHCWHTRHGNHGLLLFEGEKELDDWHKKLLDNFAALLSMCTHH
ncbi:hypothetical protein JKY79_00170 [Candidatus Babeliales bacterium]|nr:hypothetical protein [Candidatus Babeliales bacterium]